MAYREFGDLSSGQGELESTETIRIEGAQVDLPDASYVRDAAIQRDGMDLVLNGPSGSVTIEGYFAAASPPDLVAPDGATLTPELVNSFARSPQVYAQAQSETDASPVGEVSEVSGDATVTRLDGSSEPIAQGMKIYQGDVIETGDAGAVNVHFIDDTSFAVSADARLAIDEYVYDQQTQSGEQGFSVLKGLFVFTSGLIGRDDPDDVQIETPTGSIGIRGTIIAGNATSGEITLIEGAIVVRDLTGHEVSLSAQFETAHIMPGEGVRNIGLMQAADVAARFESLSVVAPTLFSSIDESATRQDANAPGHDDAVPGNANGAADQNGDSKVDGSAGTEPKVQEGAPATDGLPAEGSELAPPPVLDSTQSMLGLDPFGGYSGLEPLASDSSVLLDPYASLNFKPLQPPPLSPSLSGASTMDAKGTVVATGGDTLLPPPPPPLISGSGGGIATPADDPPVHIRTAFSGGQLAEHNIAPDVYYFKAAEGQAWSYTFAKEFINTDAPGDVLTYQLSATTQSALTGIFGAQGTGWNFNATSGLLTFVPGAVILSDQTFNIEIRAMDSAGQINAGGFRTYTFELFDGPAAMPGVSGLDSSNTLYADPGNNDDSETIGSGVLASGNKIFTGGGDDNVTVFEGQNNYINLGHTTVSGSNVVTIVSDINNTGNVIVGGDGKDVYQTAMAQNKFFGMGGDDKVDLNLSDTGLMSGLNTTGNTGILIDMGDSGFKAGVQMAANTTLRGNGLDYKFGADNTGYGDTLLLTGTGSRTLDFTTIDNHYLHGVERIDARGGLSVTMTLNYQDVMDITDYKNTLIFRADSGDTLNFNGFGASFVKVGNNISMDDSYDGSGSANFDVYSDGTVTLLVEDNGAAVNGIPAL